MLIKMEGSIMPVMKLEAEDGSCWIYRGEGAANIVLAYRGPNVDLVLFPIFSLKLDSSFVRLGATILQA